MPERWIPVARVADLEPGELKAVVVEGVHIALGREKKPWFARGRQTWFAVQRRCVHRFGDLAAGAVTRGFVVCPDHRYRFSIATGRRDTSPDDCLVRYAVRVVGDVVEIDPRPLPTAP